MVSLERHRLEFDPVGPLPSGVTVLEASAGTGKTFAISGLAVRYVAEGTPPSELLLVTFTNVAASELRERVRRRFVDVERVLAGVSPTSDDKVATLLANGPTEEVERRRRRLRGALADFDAVTIATTHGFCQEVLSELGTVGDLEPGTQFVENPEELLGQVVDDIYLRAFRPRTEAPFSRGAAGTIARVKTSNPRVSVEPRDATRESRPWLRRELALAVAQEFDARRRRMGVLTYTDQLTRLLDVLKGNNAQLATRRLRQRYGVVLVDEFQDTDLVQWAILDHAFGRQEATLVLVADPKQAIYAFRGADVYAYVQAQQDAQTTRTLNVNWRSDQPLIEAYDQLFGNAQLGHPQIVYRQVTAAPGHLTSRLSGAPVGEPLRIRVVRRDQGIRLASRGYVDRVAGQDHVTKDLADDLVRLFESKAQIEIRSEDGARRGRERVGPRHVAVLVRTNFQAGMVQTALIDAGIPAVIGSSGSVFGTAAANDWLRLLEALERPASASRAGTAALTPFLGWTAERLACATETELGDVHQSLHRWAGILRTAGVAALMQSITVSTDLAARVLSVRSGERLLTDLRHVGELLHRAMLSEQLGTSGLAGWLRHRIAEPSRDVESEELARRLESDAEATQVVTIHGSKGLEFPIVYCPFLWQASFVRKGEPVIFHDPDADDARTIDVGLEGPSFQAHKRQYEVEERGEDLRLAYVALTRARHQAVVWWVPSPTSHDSPLGRLVFSKRSDGSIPARSSVRPDDDTAWDRFQALAESAPRCISVERSVMASTPRVWGGETPAERTLSVARFDRTIDLRWRRASYSSMTAAAHDAWVGSEPEEPLDLDEPDEPTPTPGGDEAPGAFRRLSTWQSLPVGVGFGTAVHRVLEAADFTAPDLGAELAPVIPDGAGDPDVLVQSLHEAIETPLGPLLGDRRLRDLRREDRLDELQFELPIAGGDDPVGQLTVAGLASVLRERLEPSDPLFGYAERLDDPALRSAVRGYLTGSIDLVLRIGARFAIVDYKTNWLGPPEVDLLLWHYRPDALKAEMLRAHYGLQAILYSAALHRYLRWRVPGYSPDEHLAGVFYLFLRGMAGADTPTVGGQPCGVFAWRPPSGLVEAVSQVLDEGAVS